MGIARGHAVEEERVHVVVKGFVVEEELAQEAQVTAPPPLATAVNLEEGEVVVTIDLVARWVQARAFSAVPLETD